MPTYKITNNIWSTFQSFDTLDEAVQWTITNLGEGFSVELSNFQINPRTVEEKFKDDKDFGALLIETFLIDNRKISPTVTPTESIELLNKFQNIEKLASLGDIQSVKILLQSINTDDRLFTQDRKDKYISMINGYK